MGHKIIQAYRCLFFATYKFEYLRFFLDKEKPELSGQIVPDLLISNVSCNGLQITALSGFLTTIFEFYLFICYSECARVNLKARILYINWFIFYIQNHNPQYSKDINLMLMKVVQVGHSLKLVVLHPILFQC